MKQLVKLSNGKEMIVDSIDISSPHQSTIRIKNTAFTDIEKLINHDEIIAKIVVETIDENGDVTDINSRAVQMRLTSIISIMEQVNPIGEDGLANPDIVVEEPVFILTLDTVDANFRVSNLIKQLGFIENPKSLNLDDFKQFYIELSKTKLDDYLQANPLEARIQGRDRKLFNITREKQKLLTSEIITANLAHQVGEDYKPSWNAKGEPLTADWTIEQLLRLSFRISEVVRPLVSTQQRFELEIMSCTSISEVTKIDLDYSSFDIRRTGRRRDNEGGE